ncbi:MAG: hypothetical protein JXA22_08740 [Candidatus Thermoplasmatota archaeon]|nr:hypothetical protein [Candidatus Thermoplasmatota archaeon]
MVLKEDLLGKSAIVEFFGGKADVVSRCVLATAIQRSFKKKNQEGSLEVGVAEEMAEHVLNFFGYGERIIDNMLKTDDRDIFYMLEDLGILKTEREETTLYDGREWRINYWTLKKKYIADLTEGFLRPGGPDMASALSIIDEKEVYAELPDDMWDRN